jgi:beta-xylosidase
MAYLFVSYDLCCRGTRATNRTMVGRSSEITGPYLDAEGKKMSEGAAKPLLSANQKWLGPGGESILLQKDGDIIVYHAYDAKTGVPSLQVWTLTWTAAGHTLPWMAVSRMGNGSRNVFLPNALNRMICCLRISTETRNCSYKGDRDDESA